MTATTEMSWLWGAKPKHDGSDSNNASSEIPTVASPRESGVGLTAEQRGRIFGRNSAATSTEQADRELETFLNSFATPDGKPTAQQTQDSAQQQSVPAEPLKQHEYEQFHPDGSTNIHPHALYPRTMSCRQAFDQAFYCQSLGGKFNDIYRFGKLQSCSEQWGAFWFCMRTRTLPDKERANQIRNHYAEREAR